MAALQRRKGRVRRAAGPQPRARDTGRSARPSRLLTASPGCRAGAAGKHGGHLGPGSHAGGAHGTCRGSFPTPGSAQVPPPHECPAGPRAVQPHCPSALGVGTPKHPRESRPSGPRGRVTSRPSEGTLLLVSGTTRNTGTRMPSAPAEAQGRGRAAETPAGPSSPLHWGGCCASLCSWWPPRPTKPSSGGVQ